MNTGRDTAIARAFGGADHYDRHARVQRRAAAALADRIAALELDSPRVLEFGCGTGFLTEAMAERGIGGDWLITDLAPAMVDRCRARMGWRQNTRFASLNAERDDPPGAGGYDLVTASLAAQWLDNLDTAVARMLRWLAPGGQLLFNTLGAGTFGEWRDALAHAGAQAGTPPYPGLADIAAIHREAQHAAPDVTVMTETHANTRDFLLALKAIGAHTPAPGHRPVGAAQMRAAMQMFERGGCTVSYAVVTCHFNRSAGKDAA